MLPQSTVTIFVFFLFFFFFFFFFLWWDSDDYTNKLVEYRMTVHLFGATSSPGCANFGLMRSQQIMKRVRERRGGFLAPDDYVDDGLKCLSSTAKTLSLIDKSIAKCHEDGVRLCKFVSNDRELIDFLAPDDRAKDLKNVNLVSDNLCP